MQDTPLHLLQEKLELLLLLSHALFVLPLIIGIALQKIIVLLKVMTVSPVLLLTLQVKLQQLEPLQQVPIAYIVLKILTLPVMLKLLVVHLVPQDFGLLKELQLVLHQIAYSPQILIAHQ